MRMEHAHLCAQKAKQTTAKSNQAAAAGNSLEPLCGVSALLPTLHVVTLHSEAQFGTVRDFTC